MDTHLNILYSEHNICPCEIEKEVQDFFKREIKFEEDGNLYFSDTHLILSDGDISQFLKNREKIK